MRINDLYPEVITEDINYEYKTLLNPEKPVKWAKTLVGYANGNGGIMFIGVSNNGEAFGIDLEEIDKTIDHLQKTKDCEKQGIQLFHIFDVLDISTFHAYVLKLLSKHDEIDEDYIPDDIALELRNLEKIIIRYVVCGSSTKNFNKNCADLLSEKVTTAELIEERQSEINDDIFKQKLRCISNKYATLLLFWMELKRREEDKNAAEKSFDTISGLSDRQLQIFTLIGKGLGTVEIASKLNLSIKTIDTHKENIKAKLHCASSAELRQMAIEWTSNNL